MRKHKQAPEPVVVLLQQAMAHYRNGNHEAAEAMYGQILLTDPGNAHALHILGLLAFDRGDLQMAEQLIQRAATLAPHSRVHHNLGVVQQAQAKHDAAIATFRQAIELEPDYYEAATNLLFTLDMHPYATPELLMAERQAFDEGFCRPLTLAAPPHTNDPDMGRRLRVGYVSGDFRHHSAAAGFGPVILGHDPERIEVYLYSTSETHDDATDAFRARADVWCEVHDQTDGALAQIIRDDQIDILVDLSGFSKGGRLVTFALKPAPIQIGGWGYAIGTGLSAMDYLIADDVTVPPSHERYYREQILRLPHILSYAPGNTVPAVAEPPERRNGYRTYGYLGRASKISRGTMATWADILRRDPRSRLLLKHGDYRDRGMRDWIAHGLLAMGVKLSQVEVRGMTSRLDHLAVYNEIDVALDPTPQGGGMTVMDACLMGTPTVTTMGTLIGARIGASTLTTLGYDEWIAADQQRAIEIATGGALPDPQGMRDDLLGSVICNPGTAIDDAYRLAWHRWCADRQEVAA